MCVGGQGKVEEGRVKCPYHGWEYEGGGRCTNMPSTPQSKDIGVDMMPAAEQDGLIWVAPVARSPPGPLPPAPSGLPTFAAVSGSHAVLAEVQVLPRHPDYACCSLCVCGCPSLFGSVLPFWRF